MTPASCWILLALATCGALMTLTALERGVRLGWGNMFWFLSSWLTGELAIFHLVLSLLVLAGFAAFSGALHHAPGKVALGIIVASWIGLLIAQGRTRPTRKVLEQALREGLGAAYRARIPAERRALLPDEVRIHDLARPFALRTPGVEWLRDIRYGNEH